MSVYYIIKFARARDTVGPGFPSMVSALCVCLGVAVGESGNCPGGECDARS